MSRPRISIAGLLIVVAFVATGLAAVRVATPPWAGLMDSLTFFALLASLLGVGFGRGSRRVYWTGFAVLGWGYIVLVYSPWLFPSIGYHLLARKLSVMLLEQLHPAEPPPGGGFQRMAVSGGVAAAAGVSAIDFTRILAALEALLWAFLGGWAARYFASGRAPVVEPATPAADQRTS